jgi:tRNA/rRNA methyltransferase
MANFDVSHLYLINPCKLDDEAFRRSMHASAILQQATVFSSFQEATRGMDYLVGTSSVETISEKKHLRNPVYLEEMVDKLQEVEGNIGLVFGREDYGLFNEELAACDIMVKIPTSDQYSSLNLSHAVGLVLYALYIRNQGKPRTRRTIGSLEREKLFGFFADILEEINYPKHKKEKTAIMFRRIMGRALPSTWEYHTLMGVLGKTIECLKKKKQ